MSLNLRELSTRGEGLAPGHRACAGCGFPPIIRLLVTVARRPLVVVNATGCMEVVTTIYPYSAWPVPYIHNAFENAAATASGVEAAVRALVRRGRLHEPPKVVAIGGDGGTYDIGLQSLSGALERGHDFLYICYNNEGYMNTGIQRSSATPPGARTTTSPAGRVLPGKVEMRKDLTEIVAAHNIPYAAQASISHWGDLAKKLAKALATDGPTFLNVLAPCQPGWDYPPHLTVQLAEVAVETRYWPLYEVDAGRWRITVRPARVRPVADWLAMQGRFKHLVAAPDVAQRLQAWVDANWAALEARVAATRASAHPPAADQPTPAQA
ncbi:MAG: thiamine pyrophosphate-dependent enzyme [Armatimonadota bacterium]|nr:thiamine pyrophosphate-dependent enzyme [Armatimonadota bacterium]MDR7486289.1 thiamine pyrophosphate-dependent enzyme [Armatimonadota bacterium]MDR7532264.1 thiamine pyrophosphate-dependent enzyme [Armatimonadota bacterium]MDR7537263.1 thiamine pyrophosphate-dependent enzyme [Armatimonadota bacterium]